MTFILNFTKSAEEDLRRLKHTPFLEKRYKAVVKALLFLQQNPRHPGLQTHSYHSLKGPQGEKVFEAYAEQNTSAAYRIFFCYGLTKDTIIIIAIIPHP